MDFLVHMDVLPLPPGEEGQSLLRREAERARQLAEARILRRLWRIPGRRANWGIWSAASVDELHLALSSLPLFPFLSITVHPLAQHPNDPGLPLDGPEPSS
ncbi:MAG TPA: muconolactone Delta-isomerase family protein [Acidobacteriaceae bacterium]|nr:muconolactone Delta-isomerase family protein [Acidobacteriaceae bacterium]